MKLTLLDAVRVPAIAESIVATLGTLDLETRHHRLRDERFAPCTGCFECWVAHPGTCKAKDAANDVMRDMLWADVLLWACPIRFGCWDPVAKVALDKAIGLVSPLFTTVEGETHHRPRYEDYPRWGVIAVVDDTTTEAERRLFETIVARNVVNLQGGPPWVGYVHRDAGQTEVARVVATGLAALREPSDAPFPALAPFAPRSDAVGVPPRDRPRRALLWVGSAKPPGTSHSETLGAHLMKRLGEAGWATETLHAATTVKLKREGAPALVDAARRADLMVLASPVYIDCLPSLVLAGLRHLDRAQLGEEAPALLPIVQCGFPELQHNAAALEVCAVAAERIGMPWAGHLAVAGGGMLEAHPLEKGGGKVHHQIEGLDAAAKALDEGAPVPPEAIETFTKIALSPRVYRLLGDVGFMAQAYQHRALLELWKRPLETS